MAQKQLKGVSGVLGNLISSEPQQTPSQETPPETLDVPPEGVPDQQEEGQAPKPEASAEEKTSGSPKRDRRARRGRPPKTPRMAEPVQREKVSLRLRADLASTYRDWSWEERCQFSDLVDRAMEFYLKHRGKARKLEKE